MQLDTLLSQTGTAADPTSAVLRDARRQLDDAVAAQLAGRQRTRRRATLAGLVAAAASLVLVLPTVGNAPSSSASAAAVMRAAGQAAAAQPGGWPDAAYWRVMSSYKQGDRPEFRREIWIGHRVRGVLKDPGVDSGVIGLDVGLFAAGRTTLTWDQLYALPTDAAALERQLRAGIQGAGPDDDTELFVIVGDLLRESPAPPALRKALWEVAANVPGVKLIGPTRDHAGRAGTAIRHGDQEYVLDTTDGRLLEERGTAPGSWRGTYLEHGPASTAPRATR